MFKVSESLRTVLQLHLIHLYRQKESQTLIIRPKLTQTEYRFRLQLPVHCLLVVAVVSDVKVMSSIVALIIAIT